MSKFVWIQTQDRSPTLWHNEIGESFRSSKGAFTESLNVFVLPAIKFAVENSWKKITVGEFGLGIGTNYLFMNCLAHAHGIQVDYFAIERDCSAFDLGAERWQVEKPIITQLLAEFSPSKDWNNIVRAVLDAYVVPKVYSSLEEAATSAKNSAQIWFHDPFGFAVNPDGYDMNTLRLCKTLWAKKSTGFSYACNSAFQHHLAELGNIEVQAIPLKLPPLKKERLEWRTE